MSPRPVSTATAFAVAALGIACFSAMDALMKDLSLGIGTYNALLWRTAGGALIAAPFFLAMKRRPSRAAVRLHLIRGSLSAVMAMLFFWGLARVPMAQAIALCFVAPLIALFLAAMILGERIERRAIGASVLGFAGVLVILAAQAGAPQGPEVLVGSMAILCSAAIYAYNIILMRQQAQASGPVEIAFFMGLIMSGCYLVVAPFLAEVPPVDTWTPIGLAALLTFLSLLLLAWAYARAEAQHLAPVEYTGFIWASIFGFLFFAEPVRPLTVIGAAMIVAACLAAARPGARPQPETGVA